MNITYTIYSKPACPQCDQAKALLKSKKLSFYEVIVDIGQEKDQDKDYITAVVLKQLFPTARSVPQIVCSGELIGGLNELRSHLLEVTK